jgi:NADPH:quinone reductase-like Zn-dependent oxidoreductase
MHAAIYREFGPPQVVHIEDVPTPVPGDDELLIRVRATTVNSADWRARSYTVPGGLGFMAAPVFGFRHPRKPVLGTELSGDVERVGKNVTRFKPGDAVIAHPGAAFGSHAEFRCMPEAGLVVLKPPSLSYEAAAALSFGGLTALTFFKRANLKRGETVLINGASGAVGSAAVQLARHFGARVTGVCSTRNLELVRSLGADDVVDYTSQDFTQLARTWDVIMDNAGTASFSRCERSLNEGGRVLAVLGALPDMLKAPFLALTGSKRIIAGPSKPTPDDLRELARIAEAGAFKPVIGARYDLAHIAQAHAVVDTGHKRGSVVVTV